MTDPNYTHLAFLLDRSGSMAPIADKIKNGFDAFIKDQRALPGLCTVTLAQFDHEYEIQYDMMPITQVPPLELNPRGNTALLDAMGRLINETGRKLSEMEEDDRPGTVIIGIMTDGYENASVEMNQATVKAMIQHQEQIYSWTFNYLGANQDAIEVGESLGVASARSLTFDTAESESALGALSASVGRIRAAVHDGQDIMMAREAGAFTNDEREQSN